MWDDRDVDSDTIIIRSNGYQRLVRLPATPLELAIPVPIDGAIEIVGGRDGDAGGGITATIRSGAREWALPVLRPGETLRLPVLLQVPGR